MILRSVGIAGRDRRGARGRRGADAAAALLAIVGTRIDRFAVRRVAVRPGDRRPLGAARPAGDAPPGRRARPDARAAAPPRLAVPARPVQRPGRVDPARRVPSREAFDRPGRRVRRGRVRAARRSRSARTGRATSPANLADALRLLATARGGPAGPRVDSLVDVDPRLTLAQYQLLYATPGGPPRPVRRDGARRDDQGRPDRVHVYTPYGPNRDEGAGARPRPARSARPARAAGRR